MRIVAAGCLATLGLGLAVTAAWSQDRPRYSPKAANLGLIHSWFGGKQEVDITKPTGPAGPPGPPPLTVGQRAVEQDRLMKAYLRRLEVCDRLRDVAHEKNDNFLIDEASRLEEMAWKLYQTRSSKLLGVASATGDEEPLTEPKTTQTTAEMLMKSSPGGAMPSRMRNGGRLEPSRAEIPASRREEQR